MERHADLWFRRFNIVKMPIFSEWIYRFNAISINISAHFSCRNRLKFLEKCKGLKIAKIALKRKNKVGRLTFYDSETYYSYENRDIHAKLDKQIKKTEQRSQKGTYTGMDLWLITRMQWENDRFYNIGRCTN